MSNAHERDLVRGRFIANTIGIHTIIHHMTKDDIIQIHEKITWRWCDRHLFCTTVTLEQVRDSDVKGWCRSFARAWLIAIELVLIIKKKKPTHIRSVLKDNANHLRDRDWFQSSQYHCPKNNANTIFKKLKANTIARPWLILIEPIPVSQER